MFVIVIKSRLWWYLRRKLRSDEDQNHVERPQKVLSHNYVRYCNKDKREMKLFVSFLDLHVKNSLKSAKIHNFEESALKNIEKVELGEAKL